MKIGVSAFAWTKKLTPAHLDLLPKLREQGLEGFEIPMFSPTDLAAIEIRRACEASRLECSVCAILPDRNQSNQSRCFNAEEITCSSGAMH